MLFSNQDAQVWDLPHREGDLKDDNDTSDEEEETEKENQDDKPLTM